jgi:hypothetical protein
MPWTHHVADPNEGNFTVCVHTPNDDPPNSPVKYTGPRTKKERTILPGAGWTHVDRCPAESIPGTP